MIMLNSDPSNKGKWNDIAGDGEQYRFICEKGKYYTLAVAPLK